MIESASVRVLPSNPFVREPIHDIVRLAGRQREQKEISYYLKLTAQGQSPHLALIGQRGVGKTSLLNATEVMSREISLIPVRIDLNEGKCLFPVRFWYDLYCSLVEAIIGAGCWGGEQGPIYQSLFSLLYANTLEPLDRAVLKFPVAYVAYRGDRDEFACPDVLIHKDFQAISEEIKSHGFSGIVFIIDEADCLGANIPLIQQLRNIFQTTTSISLVLAGTEAVFPSLSEVFSPIPRQFHRINVKRFSRWNQTAELVYQPLIQLKPNFHSDLRPNWEVVRHIHDICSGDPAELQLYCHHMYKAVESGICDRMMLHPYVFREVLTAYSQHASEATLKAIDAITHLPDNLLFDTRWLMYSQLNSSEICTMRIFELELKNGKQLEKEDVESITSNVSDILASLYHNGVSTSPERLDFPDAPAVKGYWKSYVEAEKNNRWTWDDRNLQQILVQMVVGMVDSLAMEHSLYTQDYPLLEGLSLTDVLGSFRNEHTQLEVTEGITRTNSSESVTLLARQPDSNAIVRITPELMFDLTFLTSFAEHNICETVTEIILSVTSGKSYPFHIYCLGVEDDVMLRSSLEKWIVERNYVLSSCGLSCALTKITRGVLPTLHERETLLKKIDRADLDISDSFEPIAIKKFERGDVEGAIALFEKSVQSDDGKAVANNLGFCLALVGRYVEAKEAIEIALQAEDSHLHRYNEAITDWLVGSNELCLTKLLKLKIDIQATENRESGILYLLIFKQDKKSVFPKDKLTIEDGININLIILESTSIEEVKRNLDHRFPEDHAMVEEIVSLL